MISLAKKHSAIDLTRAGWNEVKRFPNRQTSRLKKPSMQGGRKEGRRKREVKEKHDGTGSPCETQRSLECAPVGSVVSSSSAVICCSAGAQHC